MSRVEKIEKLIREYQKTHTCDGCKHEGYRHYECIECVRKSIGEVWDFYEEGED